MKRIDGTVDGYYAIKHDLPPMEERPNKDTVASFERWILHLPGQSAAWSDYALMSCSLADFPGVPPAKKRFPEATHEIHLFAIDPTYPQVDLDAGGVALLEPVNYVVQVATTNERFRELIEQLAVKFVNGEIPAEPQGVTVNGEPAREWFEGLCREMVKS